MLNAGCRPNIDGAMRGVTTRLALLGCLVGVLAVGGCSTGPSNKTVTENIKEPGGLPGNPNGGTGSGDTYNTLVSALEATGLDSTLSGAGPFTVFAPPDAAFAVLSQEALDLLTQNPDLLRAILEYHIVSASFTTAQLRERSTVRTMLGADAKVAVSGDTIKIDEAKITTPDIEASNGFIHVIDQVLVPNVTPGVPTLPANTVTVYQIC